MENGCEDGSEIVESSPDQAVMIASKRHGMQDALNYRIQIGTRNSSLNLLFAGNLESLAFS